MTLIPIKDTTLHQGDTVLCYLDANTSNDPIEGTFQRYCGNGWEIEVNVVDEEGITGFDFWPIDECFITEAL